MVGDVAVATPTLQHASTRVDRWNRFYPRIQRRDGLNGTGSLFVGFNSWISLEAGCPSGFATKETKRSSSPTVSSCSCPILCSFLDSSVFSVLHCPLVSISPRTEMGNQGR